MSKKYNPTLVRLFLSTGLPKLIPNLRGRVASTSVDIERVYRFRYEVYLQEGYISPNPEESFKDKYDVNCVNIYVENIRKKKIVASTRLVLDSSVGFPTENLFNINKMEEERDRLVEISRFAVSREYRGKGTVFLLLVSRMYKEMKRLNVKYAYSNMPKKLAGHFAKYGFNFDELPQNDPVEINMNERALIGGYFEKKELFPYLLNVDGAERDLSIKK